jgi:phage regulator Rha-like protein
MHMTVPVEVVKGKIYLIRGQKVLLDRDLAEMYGVEVKALNQAVKRNIDRFPLDFMFQLAAEETGSLRFQIGISKPAGRGGRRYLPYVFTEQGVAMLSSVLNSERAVQVNIAIMRAFVQMRELAASNRELAGKFAELERRVGKHDEAIHTLFDAIRQMMRPEEKGKKSIGFKVEEDDAAYL